MTPDQFLKEARDSMSIEDLEKAVVLLKYHIIKKRNTTPIEIKDEPPIKCYLIKQEGPNKINIEITEFFRCISIAQIQSIIKDAEEMMSAGYRVSIDIPNF